MNGDRIQEWVDSMNPEEPAAEMVITLKNLFSVLDEDKQVKLVMDLFGDGGQDKLRSMIHL